MRKPVFVRPVRNTDKPQFISWATDKPNHADPEVIGYPTTVIRVAFTEDKVVVYAPLQQPVFIEAIAPNPESSDLELAEGLKAIVQDAVSQAYIKGSGEIYFVGTNDRTNAFAAAHGFEEIPHKVYKMKLSSLEGKND